MVTWANRFPAMAVESRRPFLEKEHKLLLKLHGEKEAQDIGLDLLEVPHRSPNLHSTLIDLSPWYNTNLGKALTPAGVRQFGNGIEFDVRGRIGLADRSPTNTIRPWNAFSAEASGILIDQKCIASIFSCALPPLRSSVRIW